MICETIITIAMHHCVSQACYKSAFEEVSSCLEKQEIQNQINLDVKRVYEDRAQQNILDDADEYINEMHEKMPIFEEFLDDHGL